MAAARPHPVPGPASSGRGARARRRATEDQGGSAPEERREAVRLLRRMFYNQPPGAPADAPPSEGLEAAGANPERPGGGGSSIGGGGNGTGAGATGAGAYVGGSGGGGKDGSVGGLGSGTGGSGVAAGSSPLFADPFSAVIEDLPLWRVEYAAFPYSQAILHVHKPHYVHMFDSIFSRPRPWVFGHLYLPGGSGSLGDPDYVMEGGTRAPLVGVLMEVTRAVRLMDGKLLILATAAARFKVVEALRELPYSRATVELMHDAEEVEAVQQAALDAALQASDDDDPVTSIMAAAGAAASDAAAAFSRAWLDAYELSVARRQMWGGGAPREGADDAETMRLVQELAEFGVPEVLSLPDGVVCGRQDLLSVAEAAEEAARRAAASSVTRWLRRLRGGSSSSSSSSSSSEDSADGGWGGKRVTSLNTVAERGVAPARPLPEEEEELDALVEAARAAGRTAAGGPAARALGEVLALEAAAWSELDAVAALVLRVRGQRASLPYGLLQLRPPPPTAAERQQEREQEQERQQQQGHGGSKVSYAFSASDGLSVHADPLLPPLRRAARFSFALPSILDLNPGEGRQALLEHSSIAGRLRATIGKLVRERKVLAALAAVASVSRPPRRKNSDDAPPSIPPPPQPGV